MKYFLYITIGILLVGEIFLGFFFNFQRTEDVVSENIDTAIRRFHSSDEYAEKKKIMQADVDEIDVLNSQMTEKNNAALSKKGGTANLYVNSKFRADSTKRAIRRDFESWVVRREAEIKAQQRVLSERNSYDNILGVGSSISIGISFYILSLALGIVSGTLLNSINFTFKSIPVETNFTFLWSVVTQFAGSLISQESLHLKTGKDFMAWACAIAFMVGFPLLCKHAGLKGSKRKESELNPVTLTETRTVTTVSHSKTLSWPLDQIGWQQAIDALVKERQLGNGTGMLSKIAKHFDVNKALVHRAVQAAMSQKPINVPHKLLETGNETPAETASNENFKKV